MDCRSQDGLVLPESIYKNLANACDALSAHLLYDMGNTNLCLICRNDDVLGDLSTVKAP
jgi:hypothetical protein